MSNKLYVEFSTTSEKEIAPQDLAHFFLTHGYSEFTIFTSLEDLVEEVSERDENDSGF